MYDNSYKEIAIQCRRPNYNEWCTVSLKNTSGKGSAEINDLGVGHCFEFRGLFEDGFGNIIYIATKESIKIKGNYPFKSLQFGKKLKVHKKL